MNLDGIETMVRSKFEDIKKHAEEIAHEIEVRSGYLRKAEQYKQLEFNLSSTLGDTESITENVQTAKSSANKNNVTAKGKAPSALYTEKGNLMKQKLEILGEDIDKNKEFLQKAKKIADGETSECFNRTMN